MENGTLYVVATPIGNLADTSLRAITVLQNADVIACEDTRKTGILLSHLAKVHTPQIEKKPTLVSYYEQNEFNRIPQLISQLLAGFSVALVSDAGTPAISDPGFRLIRECIAQNIKVDVVPGASSVITALVASGLPTDKFSFYGYLPHKSGHRKAMLENFKKISTIVSQTIILFEAPHKLHTTLQEMQEVFGDIQIVLCRELTKVHEEVRRETISQALTHFQKTAPKGEFVILFHLD